MPAGWDGALLQSECLKSAGAPSQPRRSTGAHRYGRRRGALQFSHDVYTRWSAISSMVCQRSGRSAISSIVCQRSGRPTISSIVCRRAGRPPQSRRSSPAHPEGALPYGALRTPDALSGLDRQFGSGSGGSSSGGPTPPGSRGGSEAGGRFRRPGLTAVPEGAALGGGSPTGPSPAGTPGGAPPILGGLSSEPSFGAADAAAAAQAADPKDPAASEGSETQSDSSRAADGGASAAAEGGEVDVPDSGSGSSDSGGGGGGGGAAGGGQPPAGRGLPQLRLSVGRDEERDGDLQTPRLGAGAA